MAYRERGSERPRWTVQIIACGPCGKPRGIRHTCVRRLGRAPRRTRLRPQVRVRCSTCGQRRSPFALHTCMVTTDFRQRTQRLAKRRAAARRRARDTAARRRRRQRESDARRRRREREDAARSRRLQREKEQRRGWREQEKQRHRQAAETRKATPRRERTRKPAASGTGARTRRPDYHPYDQCADDECQRKACVAYRQGVEDCPLPHGV